MELVSPEPAFNLYDASWPIWTYQSQLPPAKFIFNDDTRRGMAIDSMVSGGCIISGAYIHDSLLFSHVFVDSYSKVDCSVILPEVTIGQNCRIQHAVIDKGCIIPDGMIIGENEEDDKKRFHVSPNGVVLITPDMLGQKIRHVT